MVEATEGDSGLACKVGVVPPNKRVNLMRLGRRTMVGNRRTSYAPNVRCD